LAVAFLTDATKGVVVARAVRIDSNGLEPRIVGLARIDTWWDDARIDFICQLQCVDDWRWSGGVVCNEDVLQLN